MCFFCEKGCVFVKVFLLRLRFLVVSLWCASVFAAID